MKTLILSFLALFTFTIATAQNNTRAVHTQKSQVITKYYDTGQVYEQGTVNQDNQLNGIWKRYDKEGHLLVQGAFVNGKKEGQWLFWTDDTLKEVNFSNNKLVDYTQWKKEDYLVTQ